MNLSDIKLKVPRHVRRVLQVLMAVGAMTAIAGVILVPHRTWPNLLLASFYLLGLSLAGIVFIALQHAVGAHWAIALRRVPEAMARLLPVGGIGILAILVLHPGLYSWTRAGEHQPAFRGWWLSLNFFRGRALAFLLIWGAFAWLLLRLSTRQDADGDPRRTRRSARLSAAFIVIFAVTFWLASYDWIMSLDPHWASTIFGMYNFAGLFVSGLATLTLLVVWLRTRTAMSAVITDDHLHDLGKLLFAFSTFWAYLWFSQYMLIWYANIPEETVYFVRRLHGFWGSLFLLDFFLNWVAPFFALLPRTNKQNPGVLAKVCLVLLVGRWLDLYLMIMPQFAGYALPIGPVEIGIAAGGAGVFTFFFFRALRRVPLVPAKDPFLEESLHYHA